MKRILITLLCLTSASLFAAAGVLIVADEIPAMKVLAEKLKAEESIDSTIVTQDKLPANLSDFNAVIVYIHRNLNEPAEKALVEYTRAGGKLVPLHHSISSGKRKNKQWFPLLGVTLPEGEVDKGGYKWIEGVTLDIVNLAPNHFITTHKIKYPAQLEYRRSDPAGGAEKAVPGFTLHDSEVYLNHTFTEPRAILLGLKYRDEKTGQVYMQDRAGWVRPAGKGLIVYLMPGHSVKDFQDPVYARLVINAVLYQP